jgi:signal peptidase II
MKRKHIAFLIIGLLLVDQVVKLYIKTHMTIGESIHVFGDWFQILFLENEGAAWGMSLGGPYGKLILSLFRIFAVVVIGWFIDRLRKREAPAGVIVGIVLVFAGAMGNIIDSAFYGLIFSESTPFDVAALFTEGGGYAGFLHGKVVDMLYFPLFTIHDMPGWLGWLAGDDGVFTFFAPVFNIADSYISVAVFYLAIFQWKYFK